MQVYFSPVISIFLNILCICYSLITNSHNLKNQLRRYILNIINFYQIHIYISTLRRWYPTHPLEKNKRHRKSRLSIRNTFITIISTSMRTNENYKNRHDIPSNVRIRPVQTKEGTNYKADRAIAPPFQMYSIAIWRQHLHVERVCGSLWVDMVELS